ncbi:MAG TPA: methyltransferase domain-containing protein [Fibrobacteria bacterium]|nr:methyltransferase domain-containing protein [Fibrobacteria bacterium]
MADRSAEATLPPGLPLTDKAAKDRVRRYYAAATEDYLKYYRTGWHHHMHYGFDRDLPRGGNPTEHMVRFLAGLAGLKPDDRVLDAGCGVGGSSIFLARELGCKCVGITLVEDQARLARGFAGRGAPQALFAVNDFHLPAFKPGSFDAVWAVESFDHAVDKEAWVASMFALLKPGGRLVIADGFRAGLPEDALQAREYAGFLAGWAVPHLCSAAELETYGARAGFQLLHGEDISKDVLPHARAIFRFGLIFIPLRRLLGKFRLTSPEKLGNAYATYFQYRTLKRGLWAYCAYCFRKPA